MYNTVERESGVTMLNNNIVDNIDSSKTLFNHVFNIVHYLLCSQMQAPPPCLCNSVILH